MNVRQLFHKPALFCAILCPALIIAMTNIELNQPKPLIQDDYRLTPGFFKLISAGFWPASADFLWMKTLQSLGNLKNDPGILPVLVDNYRLITDLDPNFYEVYEQAAVMFGFYHEATEPALEMIDRGMRVYESGQAPKAFWTHPYTLLIYRAYINAYLKNDWPQAKEDYLHASQIPGSPEYLKQMRVWLEQEGSEKKLAVRVLKLLIANTQDPLAKTKYEEKLKAYE